MRKAASRCTLLVSFFWFSTVAVNAAVCDGVSTASGSDLTAVRVASGLLRPVLLDAPAGDVDRVFIVEQNGTIRIIKNGVLLPTPFVDVGPLTRSSGAGGGREQGLLGLAFHPDYVANGWFFLFQTNATGFSNEVVRYTRSAGSPDIADPNSRQLVIDIPHAIARNHNGGMIAFGPTDGYLYIGTGDGGGACDPVDAGQDLTSLSGKILRIDVDALPYTIPADNPFGPAFDPNGIALDEVWAYGLRNPWRWSFAGPMAPDPQDLYIADVGQGTWEEINYQAGSGTGGENYGWDLYEGDECPNPSCGSATCLIPSHTPPILQYPTFTGCAVTGGYVYHGCRMPDLHDRYFYSDYCAGSILSLVVSAGIVTDLNNHTADLAPGGGLSIQTIAGYGTDTRGEIYLLDYDEFGSLNGELWKIEPALASMEVSGSGATQLALGNVWTWEDLTETSAYPVAGYRIYRHAGNGSGLFTCIRAQPGISWPGGDTTILPPGNLFTYVVTAITAAGEETSPGKGTSGATRTLPASPSCP